MFTTSKKYLLRSQVANELRSRLRALTREELRQLLVSLTEIDTVIDMCYQSEETLLCPLSSLNISQAVINILVFLYINKGWRKISIIVCLEGGGQQALCLGR